MSDEQSPPWLASAKAEPSASVKRLVPRTPGDRVRFARAQGVHGNVPLPAEKVEQVRRLLAEGASRNAAARAAGVSGSTVSKIARDAGHSFDRRVTEPATQARAADMRAARRELADGLVLDALAERSRREELAGTDTRARADISRSIASTVRSIAELDALEADRAKAAAEALSTSGFDLFLDHLAGAATGTESQPGTVTPIRPGGEA